MAELKYKIIKNKSQYKDYSTNLEERFKVSHEAFNRAYELKRTNNIHDKRSESKVEKVNRMLSKAALLNAR